MKQVKNDEKRCPYCHGELKKIEGNKLVCSKCGRSYEDASRRRLFSFTKHKLNKVENCVGKKYYECDKKLGLVNDSLQDKIEKFDSLTDGEKHKDAWNDSAMFYFLYTVIIQDAQNRIDKGVINEDALTDFLNSVSTQLKGNLDSYSRIALLNEIERYISKNGLNNYEDDETETAILYVSKVIPGTEKAYSSTFSIVINNMIDIINGAIEEAMKISNDVNVMGLKLKMNRLEILSTALAKQKENEREAQSLVEQENPKALIEEREERVAKMLKLWNKIEVTPIENPEDPKKDDEYLKETKKKIDEIHKFAVEFSDFIKNEKGKRDNLLKRLDTIELSLDDISKKEDSNKDLVDDLSKRIDIARESITSQIEEINEAIKGEQEEQKRQSEEVLNAVSSIHFDLPKEENETDVELKKNVDAILDSIKDGKIIIDSSISEEIDKFIDDAQKKEKKPSFGSIKYANDIKFVIQTAVNALNTQDDVDKSYPKTLTGVCKQIVKDNDTQGICVKIRSAIENYVRYKTGYQLCDDMVWKGIWHKDHLTDGSSSASNFDKFDMLFKNEPFKNKLAKIYKETQSYIHQDALAIDNTSVFNKFMTYVEFIDKNDLYVDIKNDKQKEYELVKKVYETTEEKIKEYGELAWADEKILNSANRAQNERKAYLDSHKLTTTETV